MSLDSIIIKGAREHNLKNVTLSIPRNKFVVITGLSGSGKSSLAFDTLYSEGQRRYVESLSAYARQFLEQLEKPDVESIEGLSPTIAIEQKTVSRNPRSTVATQTEIYDYLRLLFARVGTAHCPDCGKKIERQTVQEIIDHVLQSQEGMQVLILAPIVRGRKGEYRNIKEDVTKAGFARLRVDGKVFSVSDDIKLDKYKAHSIEIVVDRLTIKSGIRSRLTDSIETALKAGQGLVIVQFSEGDADKVKSYDKTFSEHYACTECGTNIPEIEPRTFSFNSPYGACEECNGLGTKMEIDPDLLVPDESKPWVNAIAPAQRGKRAYLMYFRAVMRELAHFHGIDLETPFEDLPKKFRKIVFEGSDDVIWGKTYLGVTAYLEKMFKETDSDWLKDEISQFMSVQPCPKCKGNRLKKEFLSVKVGDLNIADVTGLSIKKAKAFFSGLELSLEQQIISAPITKEILRRLDFCINVGLDYLSLDRKSSTLSGGEAERIRLATQVGAGLVGVTYILDEPSIGLHQRDNDRLLVTLNALRDLGNSLIVVEHDEDTIRSADHVIDMGPGAGEHGGEVVYEGNVEGLLKSEKSLTGKFMSGRERIDVPKRRRQVNPESVLKVIGAKEHNLKNIDAVIPLGVFCCVTGVSGSGKSTLVNDILYKALAQHLHHSKEKPGAHKKIDGLNLLDKVIDVDQSPIGRTPRSNPATYTGLFGPIRDLFAKLPESKMRGYQPGRFSFNVKGGRCEACSGDGIKKIEMHFLPDVYVECEVCHGKRFTEQTLQVKYKDKSIADVLDMSVEEGLKIFENIPQIKRVLKTLDEIGLGYMKLGQPANTLSGGEAQRVKLATELCKPSSNHTIYILDEPTTGLHFLDVKRLLEVLQRLVDKGNTVLVIEHNLDVIKNSDYIIDLGPEGGDRGGQIVFQGTPEDLAKHKGSFTGKYLQKYLKA